jgi:hypothetical protein
MEGRTMRKTGNESGIALILVLGLMLAIAVVAVIVSLLAITERGLTASERQQRAAFEGAQAAVELIVAQLPSDSLTPIFPITLPNGVRIWNGDPADSLPGQRSLALVSKYPPPGMELGMIEYWRYDVHGAGRYVVNGNILANKGVRALVDVGPFPSGATTTF